ncbi:hypothetical protein FB451DRAFT_948117, partial [Mycena latifolia]
WIADSGTTSHVCNSKELFSTVKLDCKVDGRYVTNVLNNVLYAPTSANSLLSISKLDDAGGEAIFSHGKCTLINAKGTKLAI